jgi:hypothetical protein
MNTALHNQPDALVLQSGDFLSQVCLWTCLLAQIAAPWDETDVLPLKNLHSLQRLAITTDSTEVLRPLLSAELAAGLTSLTALELDGCPASVLQHESSCVALRSLRAGCPDGAKEELGQAEWAAVGCLTGLTEMRLLNARFLSASPECVAAVNSLPRLQVIEADVWSADMLSVLSSCVHLAEIVGHWEQGSIADFVMLPSVVWLSSTGGSPPLAAFPNLTAIEQSACLSVEAFCGIAQHCTGLTELSVFKYPSKFTSLPDDATVSARIGAIKSLSALTQLTRLDFMVQDNTEVAVLVDVAADLLPLGLKWLGVLLLHDSKRLRVCRLMQLAKLQGLSKLTVVLRPAGVSAALRRDSRGLLMAWGGIAAVDVWVPSQGNVDALKATKKKLRQEQLPCPREMKFALD